MYTSGSVLLAWGGGHGVFQSTVGDSYSQGRAVEPQKEGYPVYGAPNQLVLEVKVMSGIRHHISIGESRRVLRLGSESNRTEALSFSS